MSQSPEGRLAPDYYTPAELHRFLVADAVAGHATSLRWAIMAYVRIGKKSGKGADAAFQAVLDEVETLTGMRRMPVASGMTEAEMAALMRPGT
jgi:hypothetical protein